MIKWLHQLFNPHCEHCREEREELRIEKKHECNSCEILKLELDRAYREKQLLLDKLLKQNESDSVEIFTKEELQPARTTKNRFIPSIVRQQMVEQEDRKTLELMQKAKKDMIPPSSRVEKLEEEVLGQRVEGMEEKEGEKENAS